MTNNSVIEKVMSKVKDCNFLHHLNIDITHIEEGKVEAKIPLKQGYMQQQNVAHGGLISIIADSVAGFAVVSLTEEKSHVVTAELNVSFLRVARGKELLAKGRVIKSGKTIVWDNQLLVGKATATMVVIKG